MEERYKIETDFELNKVNKNNRMYTCIPEEMLDEDTTIDFEVKNPELFNVSFPNYELSKFEEEMRKSRFILFPFKLNPKKIVLIKD